MAPSDPSREIPLRRADGSATSSGGCPVAIDQRPVPSEEPLLRPVTQAAPEVLGSAPSAVGADSRDYRHRLSTTVFGWPRLERWCLWVEPLSGDPAARLWEERWQAAVAAALMNWGQVLPIQAVDDPAAAQVLIRRRRPPRMPDASGRLRASHGRATLTVQAVRRAGTSPPGPLLEPAVEVLLSPAQRQSAIQATALHELGHAFGLWGHSDQSGDAMAAVPGAAPVLELTLRDRATLRWLYSQPTRFGRPIPP